MSPERIIEILGLVPLPEEGGYYSEIYRAGERIPGSALPVRYAGDRSYCTSIYYLVTPDAFSALHRVRSDEIFHFYAGDPVEIFMINPDGSDAVALLGPDLELGQRPMVIVPNGTWQGSRLMGDGKWALLGCTVAPGFEFDDYEHGIRAELIRQYPHLDREITRFTRE